MQKYKRSPTINTTPFLRSPRMQSRRRVKVYLILAAIAVVTILYYTSSSGQSSSADQHTVGDFYYKTKSALDNGKDAEAKATPAVVAPAEEGEEVTKKMTKAPKPDPPSSVVGVGSAAGGAGKEEKAVIGKKRPGTDGQKPIEKPETEQDHEVEAELNSILKKSPIIIFSKSYCPHSKRAKRILLDKYIIDPKPFVVELDLHPLGLNLQGRLAELTGRHTVPNVLINGISIGGGDDVAELDDTKKLASKIKELAGKRMLEVKERPVEKGEEPAHGL